MRAMISAAVLGAGVTYTLLFISLYFEVFLLISFLERRKVSRTVSGTRTLPKVSIVVPCFNEQMSLGSTLRSLQDLKYPPQLLDIIVVDDGSRDETLAMARTFENDRRIRVFHKENGGKHTAMNLALSVSDAELIGCLDADSIVDSDALMRVAAVFQDARIAAVTPGIHVREPQTILQHMQNVEYRLSVFNRFILAALGSAFITPGPFSIFRAGVVRELGGWRHGHFTEDMEMALRMQEAGHLIANAPNAIVHTTTPRTLRALFRQRVRWTYGFLKNAADYKHMFGDRRYGNLGVLVLPTALISIGTGIYFFCRILFWTSIDLLKAYGHYELTGAVSQPTFHLFFLNTSAMWFLVLASVLLILVLISAGSLIGTGKRMPPYSTPLFILFYCFLVPLWLSAAVVRATIGTGVRWR